MQEFIDASPRQTRVYIRGEKKGKGGFGNIYKKVTIKFEKDP